MWGNMKKWGQLGGIWGKAEVYPGNKVLQMGLGACTSPNNLSPR